MGIYSDGNVYGISLVLNHNVLFEEKYEEPVRPDQLDYAKDCYSKLNEEEKDVLTIHFYTKCSTTYSLRNTEEFFAWFPATKQMLVKMFEF